VRNDYYAVEGRTAAEVRSAMDRIGPVDVDARVDARTTSFVRWSYPYERRADGCRTGSHRVDVTVTYLLPEWRPPPDTPSALVDRWHVYQRALFAHESGHELYAVRAATLLSAFLEQLPTFATCGEVDAAANAAGAYVLDELHKVERRYDNVTRHGETQGAIFR
jgi:predicted secreted Zn-dependent protease